MRIRTSLGFKWRRLAGIGRDKGPNLKEKIMVQTKKIHFRLNRDKFEKEIFNSCLTLKNLAMVHKDMPMSTDFILEQLMYSSKVLRNAYADTLQAYRNGQWEEAFDNFVENVPVKSARNFALILVKTDKMNPSQLVRYMESFEENLISVRLTQGMKRNERKSIITTLCSTASVFAILLNFTTVVVFMDTLNSLQGIF